jgi:hypothetical protein
MVSKQSLQLLALAQGRARAETESKFEISYYLMHFSLLCACLQSIYIRELEWRNFAHWERCEEIVSIGK